MPHPNAAPAFDALRDVIARFDLPGGLIDVSRFGSGHINDTFVAEFESPGKRVRCIVQRVNRSVFQDVPRLMENIVRVTAHLASKNTDGQSRCSPSPLPSREGLPYWQGADGDFWRVYPFVEGGISHEMVENPHQAFEAARAFGSFQKALADLPGGRLHETIPHFHDTPKRFEALREAADLDLAGRKSGVLAELGFAWQREPDVSRLLELARAGAIPERVTHNDTKLNNVMLDQATGEAICVVDLDTVMPGLSLYDFGDLVRSAANTAAEDETDLSKVDVSLPVFEALVEGYVAGIGDILTDAEWEHLVFAAKLMSYEVGIRFLTDHLQGDVYFKIGHPGHNLERARNQLHLVSRIEAAEEALAAVVRRCRDKC